MEIFEFIVHKDFRAALERDYREMQVCLEGQAWKSAQVLSGSIVESLLADYIIAALTTKAKKDPLSMDLGDSIALCRAEKVITDRTADLCSVVRSYRNLIHPGRGVRLAESPPDKDSATVASSLVHMIATELAAVRIEKVGMTGEQIVNKVIKDDNALSILDHLLKDTSEAQRASMLLEVIPAAHKAQQSFDDDENVPWETASSRLTATFVRTFKAASGDTKKRVAQSFVDRLKEADNSDANWYTDAFYLPEFLAHLDAGGIALVLDYLFGRVGASHTLNTIGLVRGLTRYLAPTDATRWLDPFLRGAFQAEGATRRFIARAFGDALLRTGDDFDVALRKRLDSWSDHVESDANKKSVVDDFIATVELPF